jgi:hypothetical protein
MTTLGRLAVPAVAVAACGSASAPGAGPGGKDEFSVRLTAGPENAGEVGESSFATQGDATNIVPALSAAANRVSRPVRLQTVCQGTCGDPGPKRVYALNEAVLASAASPGGPGFALDRLAPVPLEKLRSGGHAIAVRTHAADLDQEMFCGNII